MIEQIDTRFRGISQAVCCHRVGEVLIDPGPPQSIHNVIEELGDFVPTAALLTHIHIDHAGGIGALVEHYPELQVFIHESAVPHLIDPSRLIASSDRVFGDCQDFFGEVKPVPAASIRPLNDGDEVAGLRAVHTPGHSGHHLCFWHEESKALFSGDLAGETVAPHDLTIISTAPPEVDVELWLRSINRVAELYPSTLQMTHFGRVTDVAEQLERAKRELKRGSEHARDDSEEEFVTYLERKLESVPPDIAEAIYTATPPLDQLYKGYQRYWSKRGQA
ncbi:MAG: MBL fold metallo-hydrolase [Solirubrobacterales bacterium]